MAEQGPAAKLAADHNPVRDRLGLLRIRAGRYMVVGRMSVVESQLADSTAAAGDWLVAKSRGSEHTDRRTERFAPAGRMCIGESAAMVAGHKAPVRRTAKAKES